MMSFDAGAEREQLVHFMANWLAMEYVHTSLAERFYRRVRRLAKKTGLSYAQVMSDIRSDAEAQAI